LRFEWSPASSGSVGGKVNDEHKRQRAWRSSAKASERITEIAKIHELPNLGSSLAAIPTSVAFT
jgi:hypothetical protein